MLKKSLPKKKKKKKRCIDPNELLWKHTAPNKGLNKILPFGFLIFLKFGKRQNFVKPRCVICYFPHSILIHNCMFWGWFNNLNCE